MSSKSQDIPIEIKVKMKTLNFEFDDSFVFTTGLKGERIAIKLYQPQAHIFSNEYYVKNVQNGRDGIMNHEALKILLGKKEYERVRMETRRAAKRLSYQDDDYTF